MAADPLGDRLGDNVDAVGDGLEDVAAGAKGVVADDAHAWRGVIKRRSQTRDTVVRASSHTQSTTRTVLVGNLGDFLDGEHNVRGVANGLNVDGARLVVNLLLKGGRVGALDKAHLDAEAGQRNLELVVRAAVEVAAGVGVALGVEMERDPRRQRRRLPSAPPQPPLPPPHLEATMLSPARQRVAMVANCAAMPEAKATAITPPSSAAMRFSSTSFVGDPMRLRWGGRWEGVGVRQGGHKHRT